MNESRERQLPFLHTAEGGTHDAVFSSWIPLLLCEYLCANHACIKGETAPLSTYSSGWGPCCSFCAMDPSHVVWASVCKSCMARVCAAYTSCAFFQRCKCCTQSVLSTSVSLCLSCVCVGVVCSCVCMIAMVHVAPHATHVSCLVYVFMLHGTCVCQPFSGYIHVPSGVHRYAYHMALGYASVSRCPVSGESSPVPCRCYSAMSYTHIWL